MTKKKGHFKKMLNAPRVRAMILKPTVLEYGFALDQFYDYESNVSLGDGELIKDIYTRRLESTKPFKSLVSFDNSELGSLSTGKLDLDANSSKKSSKQKSVHVISLKGTMMAEGGLCTYGIDHTCEQLRTASLDTDADAIVLLTHSGGGAVVAAQRMYNEVVQARKLKPVVMYVDGMAASGAYWAAAACDEVLMGGTTTQVGSIGVVWSIPKWALEDDEDLTIYATGSEGKHDVFKAAMRGDIEFIKRKELNPIRTEFINAISKNRPQVNGEQAFTGTMFPAKDAVKVGLADKIVSSQNEAIKRAAYLARKRELQTKRKKAASAVMAITAA